MCLCVCMYGLCMHVCLCMHVSKGACGDQRSMSDFFLLLSACPLSQDIFLSHHPAPRAGRHVLGSAYLRLHSTGLRTCTTVPSSYVNAGDASPGPHACSAGTLLLSYLLSHVCLSVLLPSFHRSLYLTMLSRMASSL